MKKIAIDKDLLLQLKHPAKGNEFSAIKVLLQCNYCIEVFIESSSRQKERTISSQVELEQYLYEN